MNTPRFPMLLLGCGLVLALGAGLGARGPAGAHAGQASTPVIINADPIAPTTGDRARMLTIAGRDFQPGLTLTITTPEGASTVHAGDAILSSTETSFGVSVIFATAGPYVLVVTNPDGGVSSPYTISARALPVEAPRPVIDQVRPDQILKDPQPQDLKVEGRGFEPGFRAIVTDPIGVQVLDALVRDTTASSFTLNVPLEMAGPYELIVVNPSGIVSNVVSFIVK